MTDGLKFVAEPVEGGDYEIVLGVSNREALPPTLAQHVEELARELEHTHHVERPDIDINCNPLYCHQITISNP